MAVKVSWWNLLGKPVAVVGDFVEFFTDGMFSVSSADGSNVTVYPDQREERAVIVEGVDE